MDPRFQQESGIGVYTGNELLIKGALESGVSLVTGYPGSPLAEVFEVVHANADLFIEHGILAQIASNEALAAARLNGTQMRGMRAMMVMKCVGVHVAADALALGNIAGTHKDGGVLVVMGDDPWSEGTQVPADSRYIAQHLFMPVLEPAGFQEIKDWVRTGFEISNASRCFIGYLLTSSQADGGGTVTLRPNVYPDITFNNPAEIEPRDINIDDRVVIPPDTSRKEVEVIYERFPNLFRAVRAQGINQISAAPARGRQPFGFVSSGVSSVYLEHALELLGLSGTIPLLKLGMVYPLEPEIIREFAGMVDAMIVVEQKRDFIESQLTRVLGDLYQSGAIDRHIAVWGKKLPQGHPGIPSEHGLNASVILERLAPALLAMDRLPEGADRGRIRAELDLSVATADVNAAIPVRSPSFCPGCPHRDSASVINEIVKDFADEGYMRRRHRHSPVKLVFHGDIGCYSMLKYPPFNGLMHNLSGMGLGGGTGAGIDPFITNKQVVFVGDSTFFHSGMVSISDSIKHHQDITYIILDNKTTAMTGHQPTPGTDEDVLGRPTFAQDIDNITTGLADQDHIFTARVNPAERVEYRRMLEEVFLRDGVKVVVADKECGITFHRRERKKAGDLVRAIGYLPHQRVVHVTDSVCEACLECTRLTGCTALKFVETEYGRKIATDDSLCVADGACLRTQKCPSFEEINIYRRMAPAQAAPRELDASELPEPAVEPLTDIWGGYIAGVGGMGIGVVAAIIARAGEHQGYQVQFANKKGLAIRNGGVYAHVLFSPAGRRFSPTIPYGKADLLLGLDILEAARGIDPRINLRVGSRKHTTAIVNTSKTPTVSTLLGREDFDPVVLCALLKENTDESRFLGVDTVEMAEHVLGNKLYANMILLGAAYQRGALPVSRENLREAIRQTLGKRNMEENLKAFRLGRQLALDAERYKPPAKPRTLDEAVNHKAAMIAHDLGRRTAEQYRQLVREAVHGLRISEELKIHYAVRIHDLVIWGGTGYARDYMQGVRSVHDKDEKRLEYAATRAVIWYLHKVMAIKDEVYVAQMLTAHEKQLKDYAHYSIDPSRGDKVLIRHYNRPAFDIFGIHIEFQLVTYNWMLGIMRRMGFLRRLLPQWHRREREFRDWYRDLVDRFAYDNEAHYQVWVQVLETPEQVRGFRDVRYPGMEEARRKVAELLNDAGDQTTKKAKDINHEIHEIHER